MDDRDTFACAALPAFLPHAVVRIRRPSPLAVANGRQRPPDETVGIDASLADWACAMAFVTADRMLLAKAGQLPSQVAQLKAMADAADAAASPAAPLIDGTGAA